MIKMILIIFAFLLGGCARTTDFIDDEPVDYVNLQKLHTWQTNPKQRSCEHLYKYEGLLIFNTGRYWGFYNPESGLFATGLMLEYSTRKNEKSNLHYFLKKDGLCNKELKIPVNRKKYQKVRVLDPLEDRDLKVQKAMDTVYSYSGSNLSQDLEKELKIIDKKFYDTSYQAYSGIGEFIREFRGSLSFEGVAKGLKNLKWTKNTTLNNQNIARDNTIKFRAQQDEYVKQLNSSNSNIWGNRIANNQTLSRGNKVCTFDNYYGFIEDIAKDNIKVMWKGKVYKKTQGYFFGNISKSDAYYGVLNEINFKTLPVDDVTWTSISNLAACPFDFN